MSEMCVYQQRVSGLSTPRVVLENGRPECALVLGNDFEEMSLGSSKKRRVGIWEAIGNRADRTVHAISTKTVRGHEIEAVMRRAGRGTKRKKKKSDRKRDNPHHEANGATIRNGGYVHVLLVHAADWSCTVLTVEGWVVSSARKKSPSSTLLPSSSSSS